MTFLEKIDLYTIDTIPHKDNWHTDAMASATSLISPQDPSKYFTFIIHTVMKPSIESKIEDVLLNTMESSIESYTLIFNYLKEGTFPKPAFENLHLGI